MSTDTTVDTPEQLRTQTDDELLASAHGLVARVDTLRQHIAPDDIERDVDMFS